ncbi:TetR/AcrR family transcriptional regulator [Caballeronia cordobensis]|uniref:TetR/AcrR family transcriptional regulator n=1 Tax=Caballeronia cordobensis TaxID=1353886 RepID=UPI00045EFCAB|nr:putative membrane protein [Burkholderia sp. RPE67]
MGAAEPRSEIGQRKRILRIAAKLFAERGYHAIGMTELGEAVQLGRGALYHHIKSKEDLLYDISRNYISDLAEVAERGARLEPDPRKRIATLGSELVLKIASHQAELTVCFREIQSLTEPRRSEVLALHRRYEMAWRDTMVDGADLGIFRPYDPVVLKGVLGMYFYSYLWMRSDGRLSPTHIAQRLNDLALRMVDINGPYDASA